MNDVIRIFGIRYPIVQGGMIWVSGWKLAAAVSEAGGLGLIGAGSMHPEVFREHISQCKKATDKPFGVNIPLLYPQIRELIDIVLECGIKIVFTSAGNPATWTPILKQNGIRVVHVVSNVKFALKAQEAGVDAVVAEGYEAGGHVGREETTSMTLIPLVCDAVTIPVLGAGGLGTGRAMFAAMALGAQGVQIGSRFAASLESSAHENFKKAIVHAKEGDTVATLKDLIPVRLLKNRFYRQVQELEKSGAKPEKLKKLLATGRAKKGMFLGDLDEGELEIGQNSTLIEDIKPAAAIINEIVNEFNKTSQRMTGLELLNI